MKIRLICAVLLSVLTMACTATTATPCAPIDNRSLAETVGIPAGECVFSCP